MIPIYRAKKIDSDEWVEGYYFQDSNINKEHHFITNGDRTTIFGEHEIDPKTLAIHFSNMIDKNKKKIFASLSEDGIGGDIVDMGYNYIKQPMIMGKDMYIYDFEKSEIIEIHKG